MSVSFHGVDTAAEEESGRKGILGGVEKKGGKIDALVEIIVHAIDVGGVDHCHCGCFDETGILLEFDGFVVLRDFTVGGDATPVSCLSGDERWVAAYSSEGLTMACHTAMCWIPGC